MLSCWNLHIQWTSLAKHFFKSFFQIFFQICWCSQNKNIRVLRKTVADFFFKAAFSSKSYCDCQLKVFFLPFSKMTCMCSEELFVVLFWENLENWKFFKALSYMFSIGVLKTIHEISRKGWTSFFPKRHRAIFSFDFQRKYFDLWLSKLISACPHDHFWRKV